MTIENVLSQAPLQTTKEEVEELMKKYDNNEIDVLSELWEVKDQTISQDQTKWEKIRDICDNYEEEMEKFMNARKKT